MRGVGTAFDRRAEDWLRGALGALVPSMVGSFLLMFGAFAHAQGQNEHFGQFKHSRWDADEGAPFGLIDLIQTPDGYLWLAALDGLYRFDGVTFERIDPPVGSAMEKAAPGSLMVSRSGELWVGFRDATGVAVYRDGRLQDMKMPNPPRGVTQLAQTTDGAIWSLSGLTRDRLRRFANGRWEQADETFALPDGVAASLAAAENGVLWVTLIDPGGRSSGLAYLPAGERRFRKTSYLLGGQPRATIDRRGDLWIADTLGVRRLLDAAGKPASPAAAYPPVRDLRSVVIVFDRKGAIWGVTNSVGIFHIPAAAAGGAKLGQFRAVDGLTSDIAFRALVDREDNVWIATERGLDQFRPVSAVHEAKIPLDSIQGLAIAADKAGNVYVASKGGLFLAEPRRRPRQVARIGLEGAMLCTARDGGIWVVEPARVTRFRGDQGQASPPPVPRGDAPISCAEDRQGRLWATLESGKLAWRDARGWHPLGGEAEKINVWDMVTTPSKDLAATIPGDLGTMVGDEFRVTRLASFKLGQPTLLSSGTRDLFVGGSGGLARVRGAEIKLLDGARFPWATRLRGLVQTPRGETWLVGPRGVVRVATTALDQAFDDPNEPIAVKLFDSQDGLASAAQHVGFAGIQIVVGGDGRVWFLNREGASYFDPDSLRPNALPPPVAIRSLSSNGKVYRDPKALVLPPGSRSVDIAYAGLSLTAPQRVRFRYRLDGVDDNWIDPGARRLASYSNLGPGRYRFHVVAANNDGVWNDVGATLDFEIRPTLFQAWPFKALCVALLGGLLWLAYRFRLLVITARMHARMNERIEERERIARDLHDTLLQSVQALTLRFQLALDDLPKRAAVRPALEAAIDRADEVIAQGRDRVHELRSSHNRTELAPILADMVAAQGFDPSVAIAFETEGVARALDSAVLDEVGQIATEAIFNVRRHANARRLTILTRYGSDLSLRVMDDGVGIDPRIADQGKVGHFGLVGMRERARKLRGELDVRRLPDGGTEVVLTVPGVVAFTRATRRWRDLFGGR